MDSACNSLFITLVSLDCSISLFIFQPLFLMFMLNPDSHIVWTWHFCFQHLCKDTIFKSNFKINNEIPQLDLLPYNQLRNPFSEDPWVLTCLWSSASLQVVNAVRKVSKVTFIKTNAFCIETSRGQSRHNKLIPLHDILLMAWSKPFALKQRCCFVLKFIVGKTSHKISLSFGIQIKVSLNPILAFPGIHKSPVSTNRRTILQHSSSKW